VISLDLIREYTEDQLAVMCQEQRGIEQGCFLHGPGSYLRIRRVSTKGKVEWFLTLKTKDADRTIEIENPIDARDAQDLWSRCYWKLKKDRYVYAEGGIKWEIDLFKENGEVYFILVEAELPEDAPRPKKLPGFLKRHLIYEVPLTDDRFSNKKLADVDYAQKLYRICNRKPLLSEGKFDCKASERRERDCDQTSLE
jgi:CYTH domain-containing protein